jgi:hypothetical protein
MFEVSAEETIQLAKAEGWDVALQLEHEPDCLAAQMWSGHA